MKQGLAEVGNVPRRVLFSAHGLPEKIIRKGDPYQSQVEQTAAAIGQQLDGVEWSVCYQSRVGPLKWIGPPTMTIRSVCRITSAPTRSSFS